jgi:hypothetical protein
MENGRILGKRAFDLTFALRLFCCFFEPQQAYPIAA